MREYFATQWQVNSAQGKRSGTLGQNSITNCALKRQVNDIIILTWAFSPQLYVKQTQGAASLALG